MPSLTWKCACGAFAAPISAAAPLFCFSCHCHSCVAPARHLDSAHDNSRSALVHGGVAKAFFRLDDIALPDGLPDGSLRFLKVGPDGENIRSYTACCGTLFNTAGGKGFGYAVRPLSSVNVFDGEGKALVPQGATDCLTKFAFADYELPQGCYEGASPELQEAFGGLGPKGGDMEKYDARWLKSGEEVDEVVPITWEATEAKL